jgi:type VI secretion system protein ImpH
VKECLESEVRRFEFHQAARLLCRLAPDRKGVGGDVDPDDEAVRFRGDVSFAFPRSDVVSLDRDTEPGEPPLLTIALLGAATQSSYGSLPLPYAQLVFDQEREKSTVLRDFIACFDHRFISLYFRAFAKYQLALASELDAENAYATTLQALLGLSTEGLGERMPLPSQALLSRTGQLARTPIPSEALRGAIESYFEVPARIEQFLPAWCELELEDQSQLGRAYATLGEDLALGERVQLHQYRFRVRLGPLRLAEYEQLLPSGSAFGPLFDLIRYATTPEQTFEVQLVLAREDVPPLQLSGESGCRLGWTTWLSCEERLQDADDSVFASEVSRPRFDARAQRTRTLEKAA